MESQPMVWDVQHGAECDVKTLCTEKWRVNQ